MGDQDPDQLIHVEAEDGAYLAIPDPPSHQDLIGQAGETIAIRIIRSIQE